jgi:hypothetical protein
VAVPIFVIKGVVMNKVDEVTAAVGFENVPSNPTDIDESESLYRSGNFVKALDLLEENAGDNPELLKVGVLPYMVEFQIKDGERARGYRYYAKNGEMGEFKVKIIGTGSIEGSQFAYETLNDGITQELAEAVVAEDGSLVVTNMTIERGLVNGDLAWSVNAESEDRTGIVFQANPDGSGLADPTQRALEQNGLGGNSGSGGGSSSRTKDAVSQAECLTEAGSDVAKIQACVQ